MYSSKFLLMYHRVSVVTTKVCGNGRNRPSVVSEAKIFNFANPCDRCNYSNRNHLHQSPECTQRPMAALVSAKIYTPYVHPFSIIQGLDLLPAFARFDLALVRVQHFRSVFPHLDLSSFILLCRKNLIPEFESQ